jgi:hypothetical protein
MFNLKPGHFFVLGLVVGLVILVLIAIAVMLIVQINMLNTALMIREVIRVAM